MVCFKARAHFKNSESYFWIQSTSRYNTNFPLYRQSLVLLRKLCFVDPGKNVKLGVFYSLHNIFGVFMGLFFQKMGKLTNFIHLFENEIYGINAIGCLLWNKLGLKFSKHPSFLSQLIFKQKLQQTEVELKLRNLKFPWFFEIS